MVELDDAPPGFRFECIWDLREEAQFAQFTVADNTYGAIPVCPKNAQEVVEHALTVAAVSWGADAVADAGEAKVVVSSAVSQIQDARRQMEDHALLGRKRIVIKSRIPKRFVFIDIDGRNLVGLFDVFPSAGDAKQVASMLQESMQAKLIENQRGLVMALAVDDE